MEIGRSAGGLIRKSLHTQQTAGRANRSLGSRKIDNNEQKISQMTIARFFSFEGESVQGQEAVVPICVVDNNGRIECIGTGFFIAIYGIFVTAAHVVESVIDSEGNPLIDARGNSADNIFTLQFIPPSTMAVRQINKMSIHAREDVAIGSVETLLHKKTGEPLKNKVLILTTQSPEIGEQIATWAYPNSKTEIVGKDVSLSIVPKVYEGKIEAEHREIFCSLILDPSALL